MSEVTLPLVRYSAQTYMKSLEGLVDRYEHEDEPIHYKKAATEVVDTTCSSCLRYFGDLGLINAVKQGVYVPSTPAIDYFTKIRESRKKAVGQITSLLTDDPVFTEVTFHINEDGVKLNELAEKTVGGLDIKKDKISKIKRAVEIFAELEVLAIDDDEVVTLTSENDPDQEQVKTEDIEPETTAGERKKTST